MNKFDVVIALEKLRDQRREWYAAHAEFRKGHDTVLKVLLLHAAKNKMSVADIAHVLSISRGDVRKRMKALGLNQRDGIRLMAEHAAKALAENTELLGVDVHQIMTSPLAYLPMGDQMRRELEMKTAPPVTEIGPVVHGINFWDDEVGCGLATFDVLSISFDLDKITCLDCRKALVKA